MGMMKTLLFVIVMLVFGMVATAMASNYIFPPEPTAMYSFAGTEKINWSGLFDSIEQYNPGSHHELYSHPLETAARGTVSTGFVGGGNFFASQGLSLDSWRNLSGTCQNRNEKVSAVVAALAGFFGDDRVGIGADIHFSFNTLGQTSCVVPLPGSLWFLFSGVGTMLATRRWWRQ